MLVKEYRIPLPMPVEEYRIAQLYMIAKKSKEESKGAEAGVEILINEPYTDGPGGKGGQYTKKLYHIGSHLPAWVKSLLTTTALIVEEEAWNAYPYAKTRWKCPLVPKLSLECETYYTPDGGHQDNIFQLNNDELRERTVDIIDIVKDNDTLIAKINLNLSREQIKKYDCRQSKYNLIKSLKKLIGCKKKKTRKIREK